MDELLSELSRDEANYRASLNAAARALSLGLIDQGQFYGMMLSSVSRWLTVAWYEGAKMCGVMPQELTPPELAKMQEMIAGNLSRVNALAEYILKVRDPAGKVALNNAIRQRLKLWLNGYSQIRTLAQSMACKDQKLKWVWSPEKEHCPDCKNLNGRIYRASIWEKYQIRPQMRELACKGFNCGCRFEITTEPVTPGRPPNIKGH